MLDLTLRWLVPATLVAMMLLQPGCILQRTPIDCASLVNCPSPVEEPRPSPATTQAAKHFDHVLIVVLENQDYAAVMGDARHPGNSHLKTLAEEGALFTNFKGLFHPSYPNYLAMVGGCEFPVSHWNADGQINLPIGGVGSAPPAIGDFVTWKNYAERYPVNESHPYTISGAGKYARKHVPFLSFRKYQCSPSVVAVDPDDPTNAFLQDAMQPSRFPQYAFYSPDLINDGHDSGLEVAACWLVDFLARFRRTPVAATTLVVVTFDESSAANKSNQIYTLFLGPMVRATHVNEAYNHYNVLRTIEDNFGVQPFAMGDRGARVINNVWVTAPSEGDRPASTSNGR